MEFKSEFILISHLAKRAGKHFDLRFRNPNSTMWSSFATRKEIPIEMGKMIKMFRQPDHTEKDALLTGRIEEGEYGAGILKKIDGGTCIIKKYKSYHIIIEFRGKKLTGSYQFFKLQSMDLKENEYMFFKRREEMQEEVKLSENALSIAKTRYFMDNENWESFSQRVSDPIAGIEKEKEKYREKFSEMIYHMNFLGGGRILRNSGREKGTLLNCYHLPCGDSIEEIGEFIKDSLILWAEGGGVGCTFSTLRPHGSPIKGKGGYSSGAVSFIQAIDSVSKVIESGGSRRAAALASLNISHPDIFDFIDAKLVDGRISSFNISVEVNNDFLDAVSEDKDWNLEFGGKFYKTVKAREIWDKIILNMIEHAEPGILNMDNLTENNSWYFDPVTGVNPCGEAILAPYESCDLGSLVLSNFVDKDGTTNWNKLKETIFLGVRFLDNVLDVNKFTIEKISEKSKNGRRIGLGIMGLAEYLFKKKVRYGSEESLKYIEETMRFIRDNCYLASVELAKEKGAFLKFDKDKYLQSSFVKTLPDFIQSKIYRNGIRNVTLMAIAPTGTISLLPEVTSSIEPLFAKSFIRRDRAGNRIYIHPLYERLILEGKGKIPEWFVDTQDLRAEDHFVVQRTVQKFVDGAVSKTINLPKGITKEELSSLLLDNLKYLKGVTVYVDGSRLGQILNRMSEGQVLSYLKKNGKVVSHSLTEEDTECVPCSRGRETKTLDFKDIKEKVLKDIISKRGGN